MPLVTVLWLGGRTQVDRVPPQIGLVLFLLPTLAGLQTCWAEAVAPSVHLSVGLVLGDPDSQA